MNNEEVKYIYKYRSLYSIKNKKISFNINTLNLLKTGNIFFSAPADFNDPFDCWIPIKPRKIQEKEILESIHSNKNRKASRELRKTISEFSVNNDLKEFTNYGNKLKLDHPSVNKNMNRDILRVFKICCFSRQCNNILMWSHYADFHRGICIGLKVREKDKKEVIKFREIDNKIISLPIEDMDYDEKNKKAIIYDDKDLTVDLLRECLIKKAKLWKYEDECRIIKKDEFDNAPLMFLNTESIKEIVFGYNTHPKAIKETLLILKESDYLNFGKIKFYQMNDKPGYFELIKENLDLDYYLDL